MTVLEMMQLYEDLVRKEYIKFYKISKTTRKTFKSLRTKLEDKKIDPDDFIRVQFQTRGKRMFPSQLLSKGALERYEEYIELQDVLGLHRQQETYLDRFMEIGYTKEEALSIPIFYYYFRCMSMEDYPKEWEHKVEQEIKNIPLIKIIMGRRWSDRQTI
jgi:hypothetical protein